MTFKQQLIITEHGKSSVAESFRTLRTNIQHFKTEGSLDVIMFTSTEPREGKSTVLANLAVTFAMSDKKVLVIDCDLRKPIQHRIFERPNRGVTDYLINHTDLKSLIQNTGIPNLDLLASGPVPPNPSELLASAKMEQLLTWLKGEYDMLLIDTPPVIAVTDACVLASKADGVVLVLAINTVSPELANQAKELIQNAHGQLCGVVLNRVEAKKGYGYYYYSNNEQESQDPN